MPTIPATRTAASVTTLLDPDGAVWQTARPVTLSMSPTPIGYQPSVYVVASWRDRPYGRLPELQVRALHNGAELALRLEWEEVSPSTKPDDLDTFADAAGVLFALNGASTPIESMGAPEKPVNAWYWRPNLPAALSAIGKGAGSVTRLADESVQAQGSWRDARWRVVFARGFSAREGIGMSAPGSLIASFAVWRGSNQERAGIKAFAQAWHEIFLEG